MAKAKMTTVFYCQSCGYESSKWMGQCPGCKEWNTFVEEKIKTKDAGLGMAGRAKQEAAKPSRLSEITLSDEERMSTHMPELDRVLGGGIVPGSLLLVGGDPGIGKSTLLLQVCRYMALDNRKVLYISGEESLKQIKIRANRIGEFGENLFLLCETNLGTIEETIRHLAPDIAIIDSIQTMYQEEVSSAPGSVSQVREATNVFLQLAKGMGTSIFIVGHVTKEGTVAGPRVLEHMVDTVLYFEGDRHASYRILRGVKNRFGSTNEIGVFEMQDQGLVEVENPSALFLAERQGNISGSCVFAGIEGSRPVLVEIQALVSPTSYASPKRAVVGWDSNRLAMVLAVLEARCGMNLSSQDIYLNIAGGLKISEPAADLAVAMAVISSLTNKPLPADTVIFGEIGLSGEIRAVSQPNARLKEAFKLGFGSAITPPTHSKEKKHSLDMTCYEIGNVQRLINWFN